jgi:hypothetical protein
MYGCRRTPEEHKEEASLRKPAIVNVPIGVLTASGPALNKDFVPQVAAKFPNKAARILVVCFLCLTLSWVVSIELQFPYTHRSR